MAKSEKPIGFLLGLGARPMPIYSGDVISFGREQQNSFVIEDALASRQHAVLTCSDKGTMSLKDLGSRNGTWLNNESIPPHQAIPVQGGDAVRIGGKVIYFISNDETAEQRKVTAQTTQKIFSAETVSTGWFFKDGQIVHADEDASGKPVLKAPPAPVTRGVTVTQEIRPIGARGHDSALSGNLHDQSLPQILQFIHSNAMTGELFVEGKRHHGAIAFNNGQIFFAQSGPVNGSFAVYHCARETDGHFRFEKTANPPNRAKNVTETTVQVILESCRRMDEAHSQDGGKQEKTG